MPHQDGTYSDRADMTAQVDGSRSPRFRLAGSTWIKAMQTPAGWCTCRRGQTNEQLAAERRFALRTHNDWTSW